MESKLHFIGIGGIGMSAIAKIMLHMGYQISGSDVKEGRLTQELEKKGAKIFYQHNAANIPDDAQAVVYSSAVKEDNPERKAAVEQGIPCIERSVMLGVVTRRYKRSIAVSGTHGKTTTTAMLSQVLIGSGFDPSAIIGGKLPFIPEVHQRAGSVLGDEDHAAAAAAVAAVGAAGRHVFLPVEGNRSVPPVSRLDAYGRFIHEHGFSRLSAPIFSHFSAF